MQGMAGKTLKGAALMQSPETPDEMLDRIRLMADGDAQWDLSSNDQDALRYAVGEIECLRAACEASWKLGHKVYHNANAHEATSIDWPATRKLLAEALGKTV